MPRPSEAMEAAEHWAAFQLLLQHLPPKHRVLIQGPTNHGDWSVGVVSKTTPSHQVAGGKGPLTTAMMATALELVLQEPTEYLDKG